MKTVVVASGKGGTGKTTMTALFAVLAKRSMRVAVADADVEASNLPIALGVTESECESFVGGSTAVIDPRVCTACGACQRVCRFDAVRNPADFIHTEPFEIDTWACEGCGACERVCPSHAIAMRESTAGKACSATSLVGPMAFGQLGPGEDMSGRLVTEVRERARQAATATDADVLLIDGPPGSGCPVIAAIANTDLLVGVTEPTLSGESDLRRLLELARRFAIPAKVVLNKADLSPSGAARIRTMCMEFGAEIVAEVPYDPDVASALFRLAGGDGAIIDSAPLAPVRRAWQLIEATLGLIVT